MKTLSYSQTRQNLATTLDSVIADREPVTITRSGHDSVVLMSLGEYEAFLETAYLVRSPENARRLVSAIEDLDAGRGAPHDLVDPDA